MKKRNGRRYLTATEKVGLCSDYLDGMPISAIEKKYNCTTGGLYSVLQKYNIKVNRLPEVSKKLKARAKTANCETPPNAEKDLSNIKKVSVSGDGKGAIQDVLREIGDRKVSGILVLFE
jgi:chemotaxis response regulator CheB